MYVFVFEYTSVGNIFHLKNPKDVAYNFFRFIIENLDRFHLFIASFVRDQIVS